MVEEFLVGYTGTNADNNGEIGRCNTSGNEPADNTVSGSYQGTGEGQENDIKKLSGVKGKPEITEKEETNPSVGTPSPESGMSPLIIGGLAGIALLIAVSIAVIIVALKKKRSKDMFYDGNVTASPEEGGPDKNAVKIIDTAKRSPVRIARLHGVGRRNAQQDSFGLSEVEDRKVINDKGVLAIVADGMGGLRDGDRISSLVVVSMLQGFDAADKDEDPSSLLLRLLDKANDAVNNELGSERLGQCGSTVVSVIIRNRRLYYLSVGDSHIYVYRNGRLTQINVDHNYAAELDEMAKNGEISLDEAALDPQRGALTSYIGMGSLELIDHNEKPIALETGDRILLMSDGVYGTIHDDGIERAMKAPLKKACEIMNSMIYTEDKPRQDNFTCVVLEITDSNG